MAEEEIDWENYESGPYCVHWAEPWDCEEWCRCGHTCAKHYGGEECEADGCGCKKFVDADSPKDLNDG